MKLIARQKINGITNDFGLQAKTFEADVESEDELVELFEEQNPGFINCDYEIIEEKQAK